MLLRQRFLIGRAAKVIAHRSWPVMPFTDYRVREFCSAQDLDAVRDRTLEYRLVARRFAALARFPLDRGSTDRRSVLAETRGSRLPWSLRYWTGTLRHAFTERPRRTRGDDRFHVRLFDVNGPAWQPARSAVRELAPLVAEHLDPDTVAALLDPAKRSRQHLVPSFGAGRKAVMALVLWTARRSAPERLDEILVRHGGVAWAPPCATSSTHPSDRP
jgi:hypothetical protein